MFASRTGLVVSLVLCGCAGSKVPEQAASSATPSMPTDLELSPPQSAVIATDVPSLARPVTSFGAASRGGVVYTYGGYFGVPHSYSKEGQSGDLVRVDLAQRAQTLVATGSGVQGAQLVTSPEGLVRVGGMRAQNSEGDEERMLSLADVARFDDALGMWRALPDLPEGRSSHAAVFYEGELFVLGGWTLEGDRKSGRFATTTLVLDLEEGTYRAIPQPAQFRAAQAAVLDGKILLIGGIDAHGRTLQKVTALDPKSSTWSSVSDFPADAFGVAAASNGRSLFASARDGVVYRLDDVQGAWRKVAYLAFPRFFHQIVMLDDSKIAVLGGISGMHDGNRIAHVETIDTENPSPRVLTWTLTSPSRAKNRQGVQVAGDTVFVFGGNGSLEQHDFSPEDFRADAFAIDLATMNPTPIASFPAPRQTIQTVALDNTLVAIGGFGHDGQKARSHADAYKYDLASGAWTPYGSTLPSPRTQFGLAVDRDALWIFGGLDYDPSRAGEQQFFHPTIVLSAKPGEPFAETDVKMLRPRRAFGGAKLNGKYFMVGGMADEFASVAECDAFDFAVRSWSSFRCPAASRISPQLVALDGLLYLAGGSTPSSGTAQEGSTPPSGGPDLAPNPTLEVYDPASDSWTKLLDAIPLEPRHLTVQPYRHSLLLYSAHRPDETVQVALIVPAPAAEKEK